MNVQQASKLGAILMGIALGTGCSDKSESLAGPDIDAAFAHNAQDGAAIGTTAGWFKGKLVTFFYNKDFFCKEPPMSGAESDCELGEEPQVRPRTGNIPVLYVMTPIGFTPSNLHCPNVGNCINHPSTIDLSRVFGPGTENAALPAHSHIVDRAQGGWWELEVVGVTDPAVWAQVEAGKDLATVRTLQAAGEGITGDIPTNLFLFFNVRP